MQYFLDPIFSVSLEIIFYKFLYKAEIKNEFSKNY